MAESRIVPLADPAELAPTIDLLRRLCRGRGLWAHLHTLTTEESALLGGGFAQKTVVHLIALMRDMPNSKQKVALAIALNLTYRDEDNLDVRRRITEELTGVTANTVVRYEREGITYLAWLLRFPVNRSTPPLWVEASADGTIVGVPDGPRLLPELFQTAV